MKKRLTIIIDAWWPVVGGGQMYVLELATRLARDYHYQITIYTRKLSGQAGSVGPTIPGVTIRRYGPTSSFSNPVARLWFLTRVFFALLIHRFDLLNPQSILPGLPAWLAGRLTRTPVVLTVHGTALFLQPKNLRARWEKNIERRVLTGLRYTREITVAKNFTTLPNVNRDLVVIPNGVDLERFRQQDVAPTSAPTVLFVGRFDWVKGVDILLRAMVEVKETLPNIQLELVGYGYEEPQLRRLSDELGLNELIRWRGRLDGEDLVATYHRSRVFVLPSRSEGLPLTLLEAWAASRPVVVTDVADNRQLIQESGGGVLVPPEDPTMLAQAIIAVLKNPQTYGESGRTFVQRFSWDRTAEATAGVFEQLLSRS